MPSPILRMVHNRMISFSSRYRTYEDWLKAHPDDTTYKLRIARLHKRYPLASLNVLIGHHTADSAESSDWEYLPLSPGG